MLEQSNEVHRVLGKNQPSLYWERTNFYCTGRGPKCIALGEDQDALYWERTNLHCTGRGPTFIVLGEDQPSLYWERTNLHCTGSFQVAVVVPGAPWLSADISVVDCRFADVSFEPGEK